MFRLLSRLLGLALAVVLTATSVQAQKWGTIKGQVVLAKGEPLPKPRALNVNKNRVACLARGKLFAQNLVVDKKTRGVRHAAVFLVDARDWKKPLPIHPTLKKLANKEVAIDQPCCMFEPRLVILRQGQTLVVKNSAAIVHNIKIEGGALGPNLNRAIPPRGQIPVPNILPRLRSIPYSCSIHGWMGGYLFCLKHPYFAVTDKDGKFEIKTAPAGKYKLVIWHEEAGWVTPGGFPDKRPGGGLVIDIKAGKTTKLKPFELKP
jgi:hypothetical protein